MKNVFRNDTFPFANLHFGDLLFMDAHHKYQIGINACNNIKPKKFLFLFSALAIHNSHSFGDASFMS